MNFFLKYLTSVVNADCEVKNSNHSSIDLEKVGFEWKSSSRGCTQGILIWSKPFIIKCINENRKEEEVRNLYL